MRLTSTALLAGTAVLIMGCNANAPAPAATEAPPAATAASGEPTIRGDLLKDWQEQKDTMIKIADAMPEDKFGYKSTPAQRSYGEQIMHVASTNLDALKLVGGTAAAPAFTAESARTKADMLKALADSYDYGTALLNEQSDATITQAVDAAWLGRSTRARIVVALLTHSMDIYGQMVVYLRLNGIVPPASRGI